MVSLEKFHRIENPRSKHINIFKFLMSLLENYFLMRVLKTKNFPRYHRKWLFEELSVSMEVRSGLQCFELEKCKSQCVKSSTWRKHEKNVMLDWQWSKTKEKFMKGPSQS